MSYKFKLFCVLCNVMCLIPQISYSKCLPLHDIKYFKYKNKKYKNNLSNLIIKSNYKIHCHCVNFAKLCFN